MKSLKSAMITTEKYLLYHQYPINSYVGPAPTPTFVSDNVVTHQINPYFGATIAMTPQFYYCCYQGDRGVYPRQSYPNFGIPTNYYY